MCSTVCLFVCCVLLKVLPGNTTQYLSQMKSDLHKTFSKCQDWSTELITNIRWNACACVQAQPLKVWVSSQMYFFAILKPFLNKKTETILVDRLDLKQLFNFAEVLYILPCHWVQQISEFFSGSLYLSITYSVAPTSSS